MVEKTVEFCRREINSSLVYLYLPKELCRMAVHISMQAYQPQSVNKLFVNHQKLGQASFARSDFLLLYCVFMITVIVVKKSPRGLNSEIGGYLKELGLF